MPPELDPVAEEAWHARGAHASDDADHDEALERQDREREKQDRPPEISPLPMSVLSDELGRPGREKREKHNEPQAWGRCQACYCYGYRKQTRRGLVCYRCR